MGGDLERTCEGLVERDVSYGGMRSGQIGRNRVTNLQQNGGVQNVNLKGDLGGSKSKVAGVFRADAWGIRHSCCWVSQLIWFPFRDSISVPSFSIAASMYFCVYSPWFSLRFSRREEWELYIFRIQVPTVTILIKFLFNFYIFLW